MSWKPKISASAAFSARGNGQFSETDRSTGVTALSPSPSDHSMSSILTSIGALAAIEAPSRPDVLDRQQKAVPSLTCRTAILPFTAQFVRYVRGTMGAFLTFG